MMASENPPIDLVNEGFGSGSSGIMPAVQLWNTEFRIRKLAPRTRAVKNSLQQIPRLPLSPPSPARGEGSQRVVLTSRGTFDVS